MTTPLLKYEKMRLMLRYRLLGAASADKRYLVALNAFDFAETKYEGELRKDKVTPAFMHPLEITAFLATLLPSLRHPAETLAVGLVHDCVEDYGVSVEECHDRFGPLVSEGVRLVSKVINGVKVLSMETHFERMLESPIATVVKPADRGNNQSTMLGVFSPEKQLAYIDESEKYIIPMMKRARRLYPDQEAAYENMKFLLRNQAAFVLSQFGGQASAA